MNILGKTKRNIHKLWINISTLIHVWKILIFQPDSWISKTSEIKIRNSFSGISRIIFLFELFSSKSKKFTYSISSIIIPFLIIFLPQFIILLLDNILPELFSYIPRLSLPKDTIMSAWQVLASILGITFVIIVFISENIINKKYQEKALPFILSRTRIFFSATFGLLTLLSIGLLSVIIDNIKGNSEFLLLVGYWNIFLFICNIFIVISLYQKTIRLLHPKLFLSELLMILHDEIQFEYLQERIWQNERKEYFDFIHKSGIVVSDFGDRNNYPESRIPIFIPKNKNQIVEISDINRNLLMLAIENANRILSKVSKKHFTLLNLYSVIDGRGRRLSNETPHIVDSPPECNIFAVIYPLK